MDYFLWIIYLILLKINIRRTAVGADVISFFLSTKKKKTLGEELCLTL